MGPGPAAGAKGRLCLISRTRAKIPFLYTPATRRRQRRWRGWRPIRCGWSRLVRVLNEELGHQLAFAVERGRIAVNEGAPDASIGMEIIEPASPRRSPPTPSTAASATLARRSGRPRRRRWRGRG